MARRWLANEVRSGPDALPSGGLSRVENSGTPMKKLILILLSISITSQTGLVAAAASDADVKWASTIEKLVNSGTTKFTTQSQARVDLAKGLESKVGKKLRTEKTDAGFVLIFESTAALKTASAK